MPVLDLLLCPRLYEENLGEVPVGAHAEESYRLSRLLGYDGFYCLPGPSEEQPNRLLSDGVYVDSFGCRFRRHEGSLASDHPVGFPLQSRKDFAGYRFPDPLDEGRFRSIQAALAANRGELCSVGTVNGPFSMASLLVGYETINYLLYDDPGLVTDVMDGCVEFFNAMSTRMVECGIDVIAVCEDLGHRGGLLLSPAMIRAIVVPRLAAMVGVIKAAGKPVILHSDGNVNAILPDLVDLGIDAIHPLERAASMDLGSTKERYGHRVTLIGNVNAKTTLTCGDAASITREVQECIRIAAPGGGYVLASDHSIGPSVPPQNVYAMLRAARAYGVYSGNRTILG